MGTVKTDPLQRKQLGMIRKLLAEKGYQIYPVATWFRRSVHDFVAVPPTQPGMLLLVRPASMRKNEILTYEVADRYYHTKTHLDRHADTCGKMVWGRPLPREGDANLWHTYVSRNCQREIQLFIGP